MSPIADFCCVCGQGGALGIYGAAGAYDPVYDGAPPIPSAIAAQIAADTPLPAGFWSWWNAGGGGTPPTCGWEVDYGPGGAGAMYAIDTENSIAVPESMFAIAKFNGVACGKSPPPSQVGSTTSSGASQGCITYAEFLCAFNTPYVIAALSCTITDTPSGYTFAATATIGSVITAHAGVIQRLTTPSPGGLNAVPAPGSGGTGVIYLANCAILNPVGIVGGGTLVPNSNDASGGSLFTMSFYNTAGGFST